MNENIRRMQLNAKKNFHAGDTVSIPGNLISREEPATAVVVKIYPHYVSFKISRAGYKISLSFDQLKDVKVIKKYNNNRKKDCNIYTEAFAALNEADEEWRKCRMIRE